MQETAVNINARTKKKLAWPGRTVCVLLFYAQVSARCYSFWQGYITIGSFGAVISRDRNKHVFRSAQVVKGSNVRERCERINQSWKGESAGAELRFTVLLERYITIKRERN